MDAWNIFTLGPFVVKNGDNPLSHKLWRSRQTRTILKILLSRRGRVVPADQLMEILWPDTDEKKARRNLHVRISQLRRVLNDNGSEPLIQTVEGGYTFQETAVSTLDVAEFEKQAILGHRCLQDGLLDEALRHFQQAKTLYQGDFLAEDLYESWSFGERERLRELHLNLLTEMAECLAQQGKYRQAIQLCQDVLAVDPVREALYVRLMLIHYHAGGKNQALRVFNRCQQILANELGVKPLPETAVLAQKIQDGTLLTEATYPAPIYNGRLFDVPYSLGNPPLVGREREYAWLVDRWRDPQTRMIFISGQAGVGKSYLVNQFTGFLRSQEMPTFTLTGHAEAQLPYSTLADFIATQFIATQSNWFSSLESKTKSVLASLFPDDCQSSPLPPALSPEQETVRLQKALLTLLDTNLLTNTTLVIDDAQWVDAASLSVLLAWGEENPTVFVCRSSNLNAAHPFGSIVKPYLASQQTAQLTLRPLSDTVIAALIDQLAGQHLPGLTAQLVAQSQGNPLFLIALLQHLFEQGDLFTDTTGSWQTTGKTIASLPPSLQETIAARLSALPHTQQNVIDVTAVSGGSIDYTLLTRITQMEADTLFMAVDGLISTGILIEPRQTGHADLALAHNYYSDVAYEMLPSFRRQNLHKQTAEALIATSPEPDTLAPLVANHFLQADLPHQAAHWYAQAGDMALTRFALDEAQSYFQQALDLQADNPANLWQKLGKIYHQQALYSKSAHAYAQAVTLCESEADRIRAYLYQAESLREASRFEEAVNIAKGVLVETAVLQQHPALHAKAHITLSNVYRSGQLAPPDIIHHHLQQGLALAEEAEAARLIGEAHFWLGVLAINRGDASKALYHDEAALAQFEALNHVGWLTITYNNLAYHALLSGKPRQAQSWAEQGLALADEVEARHAAGWLLSTLGEIQTHLGLLREAQVTLTRGLKLVDSYGPPRLKPGFLVDLAIVNMAEKHWEKANAYLEEAVTLAQETAPQFVPRVQVLLAETVLGLGDLETAQQLLDSALLAAEAKQQQRVLGQAWRLQAQIHNKNGHDSQINDCFLRSYKLLETYKDGLEQARTAVAWGQWLLSQNDKQGTTLITEAKNIFSACEAVLDLRLMNCVSFPD